MRMLIGVLVGALVDQVSTALLVFPFAVAIAVHERTSAVAQAHVQEAELAYMHTHVGMYAVMLAMGYIGSIAGGYVAAWIAKRSFVLCGLLSAWLCLMEGITYHSNDGWVSPFEHAALLIAGLLCATLGGYLRLVRVNAKQAAIAA